MRVRELNMIHRSVGSNLMAKAGQIGWMLARKGIGMAFILRGESRLGFVCGSSSWMFGALRVCDMWRDQRRFLRWRLLHRRFFQKCGFTKLTTAEFSGMAHGAFVLRGYVVLLMGTGEAFSTGPYPQQKRLGFRFEASLIIR